MRLCILILLLFTGCSRFARVSSLHTGDHLNYLQSVVGTRADLTEQLGLEVAAGSYYVEDVEPMVQVGLDLDTGRLSLYYYLDVVFEKDGDVQPYGWAGFEAKF